MSIMWRKLSAAVLLVAVVLAVMLWGCRPDSHFEAPVSAPQTQNHELVKQHTDIWNLMSLSEPAIEELNRLVVSVKTQVEKNKAENPSAFAEVVEVKRSQAPPTHQEYIAKHKWRFDLMKISEPTQKELLDALEFSWKALHAPDVEPTQRKVAETIRDMMRSMGGPPPCCDDNLFARAGMASTEGLSASVQGLAEAGATDDRVNLTDLSVGELELKAAFNRDLGRVRLLLILSPT